MPIDKEKALGIQIDPFDVEIERGQLRFFATSIAEDDPAYRDSAAARAAGHRDLPVPPTFFFSLEQEADVVFGLLTDLEVDLRHVLHGEQRFVYHSLAHAGDVLQVAPRVADVFTKRDGALEFLVKETDISRDGEPIATATTTLVIRHPELER